MRICTKFMYLRGCLPITLSYIIDTYNSFHKITIGIVPDVKPGLGEWVPCRSFLSLTLYYWYHIYLYVGQSDHPSPQLMAIKAIISSLPKISLSYHLPITASAYRLFPNPNRTMSSIKSVRPARSIMNLSWFYIPSLTSADSYQQCRTT
jgi:hypothetical protein